MIIQQKQRELDELKQNFETAKKKQQAVFEYEVKEMTARVRLSATKGTEQGKAGSQKAIRETHEKQIKALEDKLQVGVHKVEKDTKLLTENYESQLDKWIMQKKHDDQKGKDDAAVSSVLHKMSLFCPQSVLSVSISF